MKFLDMLKSLLCNISLNALFSQKIIIFATIQTTTATPSNLKNCTRGVISGRKILETVKILSM